LGIGVRDKGRETVPQKGILRVFCSQEVLCSMELFTHGITIKYINK
jgi:hypothetical protein